jgi:hypothetical protein
MGRIAQAMAQGCKGKGNRVLARAAGRLARMKKTMDLKWIIGIESEGIVNQIKIAAQLDGFSFEYYEGERGKMMDSLVAKFKSGALSAKELRAIIDSQAVNAKLADTGESALQQYMRDGQALRDRGPKR